MTIYSSNLTTYSLISCSGIDAEKFLQGQLTCDVRNITKEQSSLGCYCDHKGRVLATFRLFRNDDTYFISLPTAILETFYVELKKFSAFSKVTLTNVSDQYQPIGLWGTNSSELVNDIFATNIDAANQIISNNNSTIIRITEADSAFLLLINSERNDIIARLQQQTIISDENAWDLLHIRHGIARIYPETLYLFTPHALNYPELGGVSFNKGCYRGQEIVARMHFLGKLKQHLAYAETKSPAMPQPGMKLIDEKQQIVGDIIMSATQSDNHYAMLVYVLDTAKENDSVYFEGEKVKFKKV